MASVSPPAPGTSSLPRLVLFTRTMVEPSLMESLHLALKASTEFAYRSTELVDQVKEIISRSTRVVVFANCVTKEDVTDLYNALPSFHARVTEGTVRIIVLNSIRHPKLPELLKARCAVEVVDLPISQKNIQYKIKNALIFVHQNYLKKDQSQETLEPSPVPVEVLKSSLRTTTKIGNVDVLWQAPIEFEYDFWWLENAKDIRRVVGVWLVDMIGPGPAAGVWEQVPGFDRGEEKAWMWRTRWLTDDTFQTAGGKWFFFGKLPEFSWQKAKWTFVSKTPLLGYFPNGAREPTFTRYEFKPEEGLIFFDNSHFTQLLLPRIQATLTSKTGAARDGDDQEVIETIDNLGDFELPEIPKASTGAEKINVKGDATPFDDPGVADFLRANFDLTTDEVEVRTVLDPNENLGPRYGLGAISASGVSSGTAAYEKTSIGAEIIRKNGKLGQGDFKTPKIFDVTKTSALVMLEPALAVIGDRFHLRFNFTSGEKVTELQMEWELSQIEMVYENQMLAQGSFISGDFPILEHALKKTEKRKKELKDFFEAARG